MISEDGMFRVRVVAPDGHPAIRIERLGNFDSNGTGRTWYWLGDVQMPGEIEKYVPLAALIPEQGRQ